MGFCEVVSISLLAPVSIASQSYGCSLCINKLTRGSF